VGDDGALLDVGADDVGGAAVGVDVIGTILGVVPDDEDEGVVLVAAMGDFVGDEADGVVIVGDLELRGVDAENRGAEAARVIGGG